MFKLAMICALVACVSVSALHSVEDSQYLFESWRSEHNIMYKSGEEAINRFNIFKKNLAAIEGHNVDAKAGVHTFELGMNQFGDLSEDEFSDYVHIGGILPPRSLRKQTTVFTAELVAEVGADVPDAIDWTTKGAVTPVKNQGQCGSCWAFSTTGSTEGRNAIATGNLVSLSEQQLVDCGRKEGNNGCSGGLMDYGFQYIMDNAGIDTESDYTYTGADDACKTGLKDAVTITSFKDVAPSDESALKAAVASGPVSVAIEADQFAFQFYKSGVFSKSCGTKLDHGVLVVGYGTEEGKDFWKVKNSWGASWGDAGYIKLARNVEAKEGQCGVAMQPSYPVIN